MTLPERTPIRHIWAGTTRPGLLVGPGDESIVEKLAEIRGVSVAELIGGS